ncbi:hypothetical protein Aple_080020 [Acrocarpospora pleiomorpha]|uniref:DUF4162 domain-containing protein n=1 Tax=Acrocarpospora pleiomorpha TaxID=90975 RepID=A0A5M3Y069_9ACTN|nr:hypothetical protein [Acrocarpospora pleiomorpha]GES25103.1 hypothetical protein Aple_080020 [Acrocarpospora pleiomorpha]
MINATGLVKEYGKVRALDGLSLDVARPSLDDVYLRYAGRAFADAEGVAA